MFTCFIVFIIHKLVLVIRLEIAWWIWTVDSNLINSPTWDALSFYILLRKGKGSTKNGILVDLGYPRAFLLVWGQWEINLPCRKGRQRNVHVSTRHWMERRKKILPLRILTTSSSGFEVWIQCEPKISHWQYPQGIDKSQHESPKTRLCNFKMPLVVSLLKCEKNCISKLLTYINWFGGTWPTYQYPIPLIV